MNLMSMFGGKLAEMALEHLDPLEKGLINLIEQIPAGDGEEACFMLMNHTTKEGKQVVLAIPVSVNKNSDIVTQKTIEMADKQVQVIELKTVFKNLISNGL